MLTARYYPREKAYGRYRSKYSDRGSCKLWYKDAKKLELKEAILAPIGSSYKPADLEHGLKIANLQSLNSLIKLS